MYNSLVAGQGSLTREPLFFYSNNRERRVLETANPFLNTMGENPEKPLNNNPGNGGGQETEEQKAARLAAEVAAGAPAVDYKAEAEALKVKLDEAEAAKARAEATIVENKQRMKDNPSVYKELDEAEFNARVATEATKVVDQRLADSTADMVDEVLESIQNEDERKLTKLHLEHTIQRTGFTRKAIKQDIENARAIANKAHSTVQTEEMRAALAAAQGTGGGGGGTNHDPLNPAPTPEGPKLTPREEELLARHGKTAKDVVRGSATSYPGPKQ